MGRGNSEVYCEQEGDSCYPDKTTAGSQLEKETKIRENVRRIKSNLDRGLYFIQSLVSADVAEFRFYTSSVVNVLLEGPLVGGAFLVGDLALETYLVSYPQLVISSGSNMEQNLAKSTSERLDTLLKWVGIAALHSLNISAVPEELQAEPINCKLCDQPSFGILVHDNPNSIGHSCPSPPAISF